MEQKVWEIANGAGLWICGLVIVGIVLAQALLYSKLSFKVAKEIDLSRDKCWQALRVGTISSIGPVLAIFIVMVGMISVIGAPLAWLNTALIGAVSTDLVGANIGAQSMGVELGTKAYDVVALSSSQWTMAINGIGFMLVAAVFTTRLEKVREKLGSGDKRWIAMFSASATLGLFAFLLTPHLLAGGGRLIAALTSAGAMLLFLKIASNPKFKRLKEYSLGFAMIIGIVFGMVFGL